MNLPYMDGKQWGNAAITAQGEVTFTPEDTVWVQVHREVLEQFAAIYAGVKRVRDLHRPWTDSPTLCLECDVTLPCPTLRALDGDQL